jgi:hypothetical protein
MSEQQKLIIRFEDETVASANQKASELRYQVLDASPDVSTEIVKDDNSNQDFGATLVLIFGTPVAIAIAKGIADYIKRTGTTITIEDGNGKVIAKNVNSADVARIAQAFGNKE